MQTTTLYHELPCVQDAVNLVSQTQSTVYSVLDLRAAYFQLPVTEEFAIKTTFVTPHRGSQIFTMSNGLVEQWLLLCPGFEHIV